MNLDAASNAEMGLQATNAQQHQQLQQLQQHQQHQPPHDDGDWQRNLRANNPTASSRGRQAKHPAAQTVRFDHIDSVERFREKLREHLFTSPPADPEHTEAVFAFVTTTTFQLPAQLLSQPPSQPQQHANTTLNATQAPPGYAPANGAHSQYAAHNNYASGPEAALELAMGSYTTAPAPLDTANAQAGPSETPPAATVPAVTMSVNEALQPRADPKERQKVQRVMAKACVDAIQSVDGYRYSFHNSWASREDDSFRFSYYCNDSYLNKDRAANGKGNKLGKRATKKVYDCKGVLSVKFSATKHSLDVHYKHNPVHETYEARAPPPRRDAKRRKTMGDEPNDPQVRPARRSGSADSNRRTPPPSRPRKKKAKKDDARPSNGNSLESELRDISLQSLLELIRPPLPIGPETEAAPEQPVAGEVQQGQQQQAQQQPQQPQIQPPRKRPRNSCDTCKAKKTKVCLASFLPIC